MRHYDDEPERVRILWRDYVYLAGNPFRADEEDERMRALHRELCAEGIVPDGQPAPRWEWAGGGFDVRPGAVDER